MERSMLLRSSACAKKLGCVRLLLPEVLLIVHKCRSVEVYMIVNKCSPICTDRLVDCPAHYIEMVSSQPSQQLRVRDKSVMRSSLQEELQLFVPLFYAISCYAVSSPRILCQFCPAG